MRVTARAAIEIARPREAVFDAATDPANLPKIFRKVGPIPAVEAVEMEGPSAAGAQRRVKMSDRSVMGEEITELERPVAYRYRWLNPPAAPFSLLVRTGDSDWRFAAAGGGTHIDWEYTFELTTPLAWPLAQPVLWLFRRWMAGALANLSSLVP